MPPASEPDSIRVDEVILAFTGSGEGEGRTDLKLLVERARAEFDTDKAETHCRTLIQHLTDNSADARALEALLVVGLAYPDLLRKNRISMPQEGKRLAVLLEKKGEAARAQTLLEMMAALHPGDRTIDHELSGVMRRNGNLARLVERHLSRAEEAMREGRRDEAIRWLREVLALDNSRRDVARMIRDLMFEQVQRQSAWRKRGQSIALMSVLLMAGGGLVWRESYVADQYEAVPLAADGDVAAMQTRYEAIDQLINKNFLWLGVFDAGQERARLRTELERLGAERAEAERKAAAERTRIETMADSERSSARMLAERYQYGEALEHLRLALSYAPEDWKHRAEVQRDIDAIVKWQQEHPPAGGNGSK